MILMTFCIGYDVCSLESFKLYHFLILSQRFGFLEQFSRLTLQSVSYTSESWTVPASSLWLGGELELKQSVPLPASGVVSDYNVSPVNNSGSEGFGIIDVLRSYNERDGERLLYRLLVVYTYICTAIYACNCSYNYVYSYINT